MARILTRSNRPIVIQEAQSGMDMLLSEVSKYVSPEYQQQRKENERADARFQLQVNAAQENKNRYQDSLAQQEIINDRNRRTELRQTKTFNDNQKTNARNNVTTYAKSQFEGLTSSDISSLSKDAFLIGLTEPSERVIAGKLFDNKQKKAIGEVKRFDSRYETFINKNPDSKLTKVQAESIFYDDELYKDFLTVEYLEKKPDLTDLELKTLDYYIKNKTGLENNLLKYEELQQSGVGDQTKNITNYQDALDINESRIENLLKLNKNKDTTVDAYAKKTSALSPYSDEYLGDVANLYTGGESSYDILFREESDDEVMAEPALQLATKNASSNEDIAFDTDFIRPTLSKKEFRQEIKEGNISDLDDAIYYGMFEKDKVPNWAEKILQTTRAEQKPSLDNKEEMNRLVNQFKEDISTDESTLNEKMPAFLDEPAPQRPYTTPQSSQSEIEGDVNLENLSRFLYSPESVNPLQQSQVVEPPIDKDEKKRIKSIEREQKLTSADEYNFKNRQIMNTKSGSPININTAVGLVSKNLNKINKLKNNYNKSKGNKKLILAKGITQEQNKMKELINDYITSDATFKDKKFDENFYNKLSSKLNISSSELKKLISFNIGLNI